MTKNILNLFVLLSVLGLMTTVEAKTTINKKKNTKKSKLKKRRRYKRIKSTKKAPKLKALDGFSLGLSMQASQNLREDESSGKVETQSLGFSIGKKIDAKNSVSVGSQIYKSNIDLTDNDLEDETYVGNTSISHRYKFDKIESFSPSLSTSVIIPTNETAKVNQGLITVISLSPSISHTSATVLGDTRVGLSMGVSKYFHEYDTATNGERNSNFMWQTMANLSITPIKYISLSTGVGIVENFTYNNVRNEYYQYNASLGLNLITNTQFTIGIRNQGKTFKDNGEKNIRAIDYDTSETYIGISISI